MAYSLPYEVYVLLEEAFNRDRAKAEVFAHAVEEVLQAIEQQAEERITAKKEATKAEVYNELRNELATKEFVRAEVNELRAEFRSEISELRAEIRSEISELRTEMNELRTEISELRSELKQNALLLKVLIGIAVFGLTLFNPAFVKLLELLMK